MTKIRKTIKEIFSMFGPKTIYEAKEAFLNCETTLSTDNAITLLYFLITIVLYFISAILFFTKINFVGYILCTLLLCYMITSVCSEKLFNFTLQSLYNIIDIIFKRYGRVISRKDWHNISRNLSFKDYIFVHTRKCVGYCYKTSHLIASSLKNARLLYCAFQRKDGSYTAHSVILKNGYVYDTNLKRHYEYNYYVKRFNLKVYKTFSYKKYSKETFFTDISYDFKKWCNQNDVYVDFY